MNSHQTLRTRKNTTATSIFLAVAGLTISERSYTATLLTGGKVLIAGGVDEGDTQHPKRASSIPLLGHSRRREGSSPLALDTPPRCSMTAKFLVTGGTR